MRKNNLILAVGTILLLCLHWGVYSQESAQEGVSLKLSLKKGDILEAKVHSKYRFLRADQKHPYQEIDVHLNIRFTVIKQENGKYTLKGKFLSAKSSLTIDLLKARGQPLPLPRTLEQPSDVIDTQNQMQPSIFKKGLTLIIGTKKEEARCIPSLAMREEQDIFSAPHILLAIGFFDFPEESIKVNSKWGEIKKEDKMAYTEVYYKLVKCQNNVATIETFADIHVKDIKKYLKQKMEVLPFTLMDYKLKINTLYDVKQNLPISAGGKARYVLMVNHEEGKITEYIEQTINVNLHKKEKKNDN